MYKLLEEEQVFYKYYEWCLDPMPRWDYLKDKFIEEISRWQKCQGGWQERQHALNCWLMASALWQGLSDYLIRGNLNLRALAKYAGRFKIIFYNCQAINESLLHLRNLVFERRLSKQYASLSTLLSKLSKCIIKDEPANDSEKGQISRWAGKLCNERFPKKLRNSRINIPSAFRSQDLTHYDFVHLLEKYVNDKKGYSHPIIVIGLRTTGAYVAPLAQAYLQNSGFDVMDITTIRPKDCISVSEKTIIESGSFQKAQFLIIDETASAGSTMNYTLEILDKFRIPHAKVSFVFPVYPAHNKWKHDFSRKNLAIYTLPSDEWRIVNNLRLENIREYLKDYYSNQELEIIDIKVSEKGRKIDKRFGQAERVGWRLKQVYLVLLRDRQGRIFEEEILAKGVGLGWLGYHAYIQGSKLSDYAPPVLGLRNGLIFMRWIDGKNFRSDDIEAGKIFPAILKYIYARRERLPLNEDRTFKEYSKRYYGGTWLCSILCKAYGNKVGHLIKPLMRKLLQTYRTEFPAVIDGKMSPEDWLVDKGRFYKVDYEHHGFGKTQLNIADPVFDLASFIFEFRINKDQQDKIINEYINHTKDFKAKDKVILYLWLIAHHNIYTAADYLSEPDDSEMAFKENLKCLEDKEYMNLLSTEYFGKLTELPKIKRNNRIFISMDIDGILDREIWDFPTTTMAGINAVRALHKNGFPIFINSARSLREAKAYCRNFSFDGGISEYGSALWDENRKRQLVLVDSKTIEQLRKMREMISGLPDVYINPYYEHTIKAFCYTGRHTRPLEAEKITEIIVKNRFDSLRVFSSGTDTIIMSNQLDKGTGIESMVRELPFKPLAIISVGDSERDVPMFHRSDLFFAPDALLNKCPQLKESKNLRVIKQFQPGLLSAAEFLSREYGGNGTLKKIKKDNLILSLIDIADRPILFRLYSLLYTKKLLTRA